MVATHIEALHLAGDRCHATSTLAVSASGAMYFNVVRERNAEV